MSISKSAFSTVTTRPPARRRWRVLLILFLVIAVAAFVVYRTTPLARLADARAQWASNGLSDYRIIVEYELPLYSCQQDLDVRNGEVDYRNQDSCRMTPVLGANQGIMEMLTVNGLFARVEQAVTTPECGPNGCVCDGPITVDVTYDAEMGYPQVLNYRLAPEDRWRSLEFWLAQISGSPPCPPASYIGQIITVTSLEPLKPQVEMGNLFGEATPELDPPKPTMEMGNLLDELTPDVESATPEVKPTFPPTIR